MHAKSPSRVLDSRRVYERLDHRASDGDLQHAGLDVRLALERLYTLVRARHGAPGFDVRKWSNHSAEKGLGDDARPDLADLPYPVTPPMPRA